VEAFRFRQGLGIVACGSCAEINVLCVRACVRALPVVSKGGAGTQCFKEAVLLLDSFQPAFTPLAPYQCAVLTAVDDPEAVRGLVTCCIPSACSAQASVVSFWVTWETRDQQSRLQERLPAQRVELTGIF
jgi:hypothetical protein